jgi:hypothetical protein
MARSRASARRVVVLKAGSKTLALRRSNHHKERRR